MLGLGVIVPPCMHGLTAVEVLAWIFSPTRRLMLMPSTGMGVFCYSQTDAYAFGIFDNFTYSVTGCLWRKAINRFS